MKIGHRSSHVSFCFQFNHWSEPISSSLSKHKSLATPMGQMPILEVDGKVVHQSAAILRYLGRRFGLAGSNDWEALLIETVADSITDFRISKKKFWLVLSAKMLKIIWIYRTICGMV